MIYTFIRASQRCCLDREYGKIAAPTAMPLVQALQAEAILAATAFVLGLLALLSVIEMPPAAAYTLLGVGSTIIAIDLLCFACERRGFKREMQMSLPKVPGESFGSLIYDTDDSIEEYVPF